MASTTTGVPPVPSCVVVYLTVAVLSEPPVFSVTVKLAVSPVTPLSVSHEGLPTIWTVTVSLDWKVWVTVPAAEPVVLGVTESVAGCAGLSTVMVFAIAGPEIPVVESVMV